MTALRAEAIRMIEQAPESKVSGLMAVMRDFLYRKDSTSERAESRTATSPAFDNFLSHCKKGTLKEDYNEELSNILENEYEGIH